MTRILINTIHIERLVLANTREEAEKILKEHHNFIAWTADCARIQRYAYVMGYLEGYGLILFCISSEGGGTTSAIG